MAEDSNTVERIRAIIAEQLERKIEEVVDDAGFTDDLGADSLDLTELLMALEEEFDVEVGDDANDIETVGDAIAYMQSKL